MSVTIREFAKDSQLLTGHEGLNQEIRSPQICSPDLSIPTTLKGITSSVVHIRPRQIAYLCALPQRECQQLASYIMNLKPACILLSGRTVCEEFLAAANMSHIPVIKSNNVGRMVDFLVARLTPKISLHGVLVQIFDLGTLLLGESAVGKSEAALDLVLRGHKLAADDMVVIEKKNDDVYGGPLELGTDLLQIRGLGVINIRALYGESSMVNTCKVGLVVELEEWQTGHQYSLVGLKERRYRLLGVSLPYLKLPVKPGRNMSTLIEVAARNQILKNRGIFTARDLNRKLNKKLSG